MCFIRHFSYSQGENILDNFYLIESNGTVVVNWTISIGNTCNGIQIYRSTDSLNYTQVGSIEGICGNLSSSQPYSFTDFDPIENKTNYYLIELGLNGKTNPLAVEIIEVGESGNKIIPNPAKDHARVYFQNKNNSESKLILFDSSGNIVSLFDSNLEFFDLDLSNNISGLYLFSITIKDQIITSGRLIISK